MAELDSDDSRPPYQQLADALAKKIRSGEIADGAPLPSIRDLAVGYGVSEGTVKRALRELRDQKLIVTRHGIGSTARASGRVETDELGDLRQVVADLVERVETLERKLGER